MGGWGGIVPYTVYCDTSWVDRDGEGWGKGVVRGGGVLPLTAIPWVDRKRGRVEGWG